MDGRPKSPTPEVKIKDKIRAPRNTSNKWKKGEFFVAKRSCIREPLMLNRKKLVFVCHCKQSDALLKTSECTHDVCCMCCHVRK